MLSITAGGCSDRPTRFRVIVTSEDELPPLPSKLTGGGPGMVKDI